MLKLSDQEIIDQLKNGNTNVIRIFYYDFEKITGYIFQNNGNEEEAKDIFHEALIVLYEKITNGEFKLESKLSTYLYAVCKNLWLMHLRKNKKLISNNIESNKFQNILTDENDILQEEQEEREERIQVLMKKINELGDPCYSILIMFYFKKLSYKIIAKKLNYSTEKVVKNQKYRCLQKIKESLNGSI